jgi:hypothetical protein
MSIIPRCIVLALAALIALFAAEPAGAQDSTAKITIAVSLNGPSSLLGQLSLYGARLAIEEANASGERPRVALTEYEDVGDPSRGRAIAEQITASGVLAVIGPASTPMALAVEPVYAEHGLVAIGTSATGDATTNATTFFRSTYSTSEAGESIASYLFYALGNSRPSVLFKERARCWPKACFRPRSRPGMPLRRPAGLDSCWALRHRRQRNSRDRAAASSISSGVSAEALMRAKSARSPLQHRRLPVERAIAFFFRVEGWRTVFFRMLHAPHPR